MARSAAEDPAPGVAAWESVVDAIGPKVREDRQRAGLSLQQLARRADVSAAAIHKVERGDMVPTVTTLLKLAAALDRPIGWYMDDGPPAPVTSLVTRPDLPAPDDGVARAAVTARSGRFRTAGTLVEIASGAALDDPAGPAGEELLQHVLDGTVEVDVDGEAHTLAGGDTLQYPADRPARWRNPGPAPARVLRVSSPG